MRIGVMMMAVVMPVIVRVTMVVIVRMSVIMMMIMPVVVIMAVVMIVVVVMCMAVIMVVMTCGRLVLQALVRTLVILTIFTVLGIDPFHVMMVTFLLKANLVLEPEHLRTILAELAVHVVGALKDLGDAINEGFNDIVLVIEIVGLDELDVRMASRDLVGEVVDAAHENAGEEEIGENDDPLVAKAGGVFEARFHEREGHPGIANFAPAKAHAFPKKAHQFVDVRVGIRIGCATTNHHQHGVGERHIAMLRIGSVYRFLNARTGSLDHLEIKAKLASIFNRDAGVSWPDRH